jgi:hypothetical protein
MSERTHLLTRWLRLRAEAGLFFGQECGAQEMRSEER